MASNNLFHERAELLDTIYPVSSSTVVNGAWVSVAGFDEIHIHIAIGLIAATGTVNADVNQATDSSGTGNKNLTDLAGNDVAITQLADAADNVDIVISVLPSQLDTNNDFDHIRLSVTPATAAALLSATVWGVRAHQAPVAITGFQEVILPT